MKTKTIRHLAAALALACVASACGPSYNFISMEDHPTREIMIIDVEATRPIVPFLLHATSREFWMCTESDSMLDCRRACKPPIETTTEDMNNPDLVLCPGVGEGISVKNTKNPNLNVTATPGAPLSPPPVEPPAEDPAEDPAEEPPATPDEGTP